MKNLKEEYKEEAMKYRDLFVPHMCSEVEYAYLVEGRTQEKLSTKHEADASVAHVVSTEVGIPICVIDDTGKEVLGYRLGSGDHQGRAIIIRHGHAYVPTTSIPIEDISHLLPYDYHIAQIFKGEEYDVIEDKEVNADETNTDQESSDEEEEEPDGREELPTGVNPDPEVVEDEIEASADFVTAVRSAIAFMQHHSKCAKATVAAKAVAPLVAFACGIYTLL